MWPCLCVVMVVRQDSFRYLLGRNADTWAAFTVLPPLVPPHVHISSLASCAPTPSDCTSADVRDYTRRYRINENKSSCNECPLDVSLSCYGTWRWRISSKKYTVSFLWKANCSPSVCLSILVKQLNRCSWNLLLVQIWCLSKLSHRHTPVLKSNKSGCHFYVKTIPPSPRFCAHHQLTSLCGYPRRQYPEHRYDTHLVSSCLFVCLFVCLFMCLCI
jgi:hypothetical protein